MPDQSRPWQVNERTACLRLARSTATVSLEAPERGLGDWTIDGQPISSARLLQVGLPHVEQPHERALVEHYIRGNDLVATYVERPGPQMHTQIYWRAVEPSSAATIAAVEVLVSVQTNLLDSCPRVVMRSELNASEVFRLTDANRGDFEPLTAPRRDFRIAAGAPACLVFRLGGHRLSYAEMTQHCEGESTSLDVAAADDSCHVEVRHGLFSQRLEKGVILKARALGVLLDRQADQQAAALHYRALLAEEPPLTA